MSLLFGDNYTVTLNHKFICCFEREYVSSLGKHIGLPHAYSTVRQPARACWTNNPRVQSNAVKMTKCISSKQNTTT